MPVSLDVDFALITDLVRAHARDDPQRRALVLGECSLSYADLDRAMDRVAGALQREGLRPGDAIAVCGGMSIDFAVVFLGALRAGVVVAPLAPG